MTLINSRLRLLIVMLSIVLVAVVVWIAWGKSAFDRSTGPWATFNVPPGAEPLKAEIVVRGSAVRICNRDSTEWDDILVRIDGGYLAKIEKLQPTQCSEIPLADFAYSSWKRMPPPKGMVPKTIEAVVTMRRRAYGRKVF